MAETVRASVGEPHVPRAKRLVMAVACALVLLLGWIGATYPFDGLSGAIFTLALGDATEYAAGYSDSNFTAVRKGMSMPQVRDLLGEPLFVSSVSKYDGTVNWVYTRRTRDTHYRERVVVFKDGVVVRILAEYYLD